MKSLNLFKITIVAISCLFSSPKAIFAQQLDLTWRGDHAVTQAQVTPDNTVNTTVNQNGNVAEITGGRTEGNNLFHSFQDFSVGTGNEAFFNNAQAIENIFSRVTGGNISNIDGAIRANGSASLFLVNPAGIIFGENARLDVGGSFIGSTADSILFPDDIQFSASDSSAQPILTVNDPIGLGFRDNPGDIVNRANTFDDGGTPDDLFDDFTIGLSIGDNRTIGLIGGNVSFDGGFVTALGGRIEVGSVAENSTVSFTAIESGWDIGYEQVISFQDISLDALSQIGSSSKGNEVTEDIQVKGRNIALTRGSQLGITSLVGEAGDVLVQASESITVDGNSIEIGVSTVHSTIFSVIDNQASGENSQIVVETPQLNLSNSGAISAINLGSTGRGVDVLVTAEEMSLDGTINFETDFPFPTGIFAQTFEAGVGDGGTIEVEANKLTIDNGAEINTQNFGSGNAGDLIVNAGELVKLTGTNLNSPSALQATAEQAIAATGNSGDITVNTPKLIIENGAQVNSVTLGQENGSSININASEFVRLSGIAPTTELNLGRTGISVSAATSFNSESGESVPTTGNAGSINIATKDLDIEQGAAISANTFSLGNGGNAVINVDNLTIKDGGQIRAGSLTGGDPTNNQLGRGGNLDISATDSVSIEGNGDINGEPVASSISTTSEGTGDAGNITLNTNNLQLLDQSQITSSAVRIGNGGNITIDSRTILGIQNSDITANAVGGNGGNITIDSDFIVGLKERSRLTPFSDITASSEFGIDGTVTINTPENNLDEQVYAGFKTYTVTQNRELLKQRCLNPRNPKGKIVDVGRAGVPANPDNFFDDEEVIAIEGIENNEAQTDTRAPVWVEGDPIEEPNAVKVGADGETYLVTETSASNASIEGVESQICRSKVKSNQQPSREQELALKAFKKNFSI